ncbi:MAG: hypothetical protein EOP84_04000 [Verrucomicrobiaceae bacterium]|nr:MAG: hypothetical protein EOP84_04000 [Verrucomicrobiaceae bacterium]
MNHLKPLLHTIYRQARASHHSGPDAPKMLQQQHERVAVAMTALVLRHDSGFLQQFLKYVCGREKGTLEHWEVTLEIPGCGDLVLLSKDEVFVLEFKISSPLEPRQKPEAKGGYRDRIDEYYSAVGKRHYIIVQNDQGIESTERGTYKTWHDVRDAIVASPLALTQDLSESLANLNIPAFSYGKTAKLKLSQHAPTAAQIFRLLENVADGAFAFRRTRWDVSDEDNYIGKSIQKGKGLEDAEQIIEPYSNELGWFGYEGTQLSVWFYCGGKGTVAVRKRLEKLWPQQAITEGGNVGVRIESENVEADQGFFEKTLAVVFTPKAGK